MWAIDKPITATLIRDIVDGINAKFRELKSNGYIVEGKCWFDEESNDKETPQGRETVYRLRLYTGSATGKPDPAPAYHR